MTDWLSADEVRRERATRMASLGPDPFYTYDIGDLPGDHGRHIVRAIAVLNDPGTQIDDFDDAVDAQELLRRIWLACRAAVGREP